MQIRCLFFIFSYVISQQLTVFPDYFCENEQYKDINAMKKLLQTRQEEVKAINHERSLVDAIITMCHSLEEHARGISSLT